MATLQVTNRSVTDRACESDRTGDGQGPTRERVAACAQVWLYQILGTYLALLPYAKSKTTKGLESPCANGPSPLIVLKVSSVNLDTACTRHQHLVFSRAGTSRSVRLSFRRASFAEASLARRSCLRGGGGWQLANQTNEKEGLLWHSCGSAGRLAILAGPGASVACEVCAQFTSFQNIPTTMLRRACFVRGPQSTDSAEFLVGRTNIPSSTVKCGARPIGSPQSTQDDRRDPGSVVRKSSRSVFLWQFARSKVLWVAVCCFPKKPRCFPLQSKALHLPPPCWMRTRTARNFLCVHEARLHTPLVLGWPPCVSSRAHSAALCCVVHVVSRLQKGAH